MSNSDNKTKNSPSTTKLIFAGIILVLSLVFIFSNRGTATLHILSIQFIAPGWVWFLVLLAAGFTVGSIFPWFRRKKN